MAKWDVGFNTELFRHFTVEAETKEEAFKNGWDALMDGTNPDCEEEGMHDCTGVMELEAQPPAPSGPAAEGKAG